MGASTVAATLGQVGLPAPLAELAARRWDAVVVGGGHNGLTAAAYLARAGRSVLVLERRERLGGACTLEQPFADPGYLVSPCAYVVGLLDQTVVDELGLERYGYRVFVADPNLWVPFADGTSLAQFVDHGQTVAHLRANRFSERDIQGCWPMRTCSTGCAFTCGPVPRATAGRAPRPPATSWRSASATTAS
jgi:choline dehydrogenase-like flavoprotein